MTKIVYRQDDGIVAVVSLPPDECMPINSETGEKFTIDEVAARDVPTRYKYKKIEDSDVPTDRTFRNAWTIDESDLTDGVGS